MSQIDYPPTPRARAEALPTNPEAFLEWVDFNTLNDILAGMQRRAGVLRPKELRKEQVVFVDAPPEDEARTALAFTSFGDPTIRVVKDKFFAQAPTPATTLKLLSSIVHEGLHVLSEAPAEVHSDTHEAGATVERSVTVRARTGLEMRQKYTRQELPNVGEPKKIMENRSVAGVSLNEALTETLALEVLKEYLKRTGYSTLVAHAPPEDLKEIGQLSYPSERMALQFMGRILAERLGVEEDVVHQAFVREYFEHELRSHLSLMRLLQEGWDGAERQLGGGFVESILLRDSGEGLEGEIDREAKGFIKEDASREELYAQLRKKINDWDKVDVLAGALKLR